MRWLLVLALLCALTPGGRAAQTVPVLPVLAEIGPWPVVSRLVAYDGRLWFANSVKGVNHNSADLYAYEPASGETRYMRHLFSQDAGRPLVHEGLLYWPLEDARISLGWGQIEVTNGRSWQTLTVPTATAFHTHALAGQSGRLVAATSAWRAGFQVSNDGGLTWREIYDHPTPDGRVSRVTELASLGGSVVGSLNSRNGRGLLMLGYGQVAPVPGWPSDRAVLAIAVFGGWLYGLVRGDDGVVLWRSDGLASEALPAPRADWRPRHIAADDEGLWAVEGSGRLWRSDDGEAWQLTARLSGGTPWEVALLDGKPYVGGAGEDGRGVLWGPAPGQAVAKAGPSATFRQREPGPDRDWAAAGVELDRLLADPASYTGYRGGLRERLYELALSGPPAGFFTQRLWPREPDQTLGLIGGAVETPAWTLRRWLLLWAIGLSGAGPVPIKLIEAPWDAAPNRAEKYFAPAPAAAWAAAQIGQRDRATIDALIARLGNDGDPDWLTGDLVGALSALTGQVFAYDLDAWRAWWTEVRDGWGEG
ncbi:MAG: hypothetical protein AAF495_05185 [Pseudomonadota bacterium]